MIYEPFSEHRQWTMQNFRFFWNRPTSESGSDTIVGLNVQNQIFKKFSMAPKKIHKVCESMFFLFWITLENIYWFLSMTLGRVEWSLSFMSWIIKFQRRCHLFLVRMLNFFFHLQHTTDSNAFTICQNRVSNFLWKTWWARWSKNFALGLVKAATCNHRMCMASI